MRPVVLSLLLVVHPHGRRPPHACLIWFNYYKKLKITSPVLSLDLLSKAASARSLFGKNHNMAPLLVFCLCADLLCSQLPLK